MAEIAERSRPRNDNPIGAGPVVYWMQRDARAEDNWALLYAQSQAEKRGVPLCVVFCLLSKYVNAGVRHYDFLLQGLAETQRDLVRRNIAFVLLEGEPVTEISQFVEMYQVGELVCDFNPLRFARAWRDELGQQLTVRLTEVDAHNIIPCWVASEKEEFAAHTFRPKVHKLLSHYLGEFPSLSSQSNKGPFISSKFDLESVRAQMTLDESVPPVDWLTPGTQAAKLTLRKFLNERINAYAKKRNDPNEPVLSGLSPYLHFGQVASQWVAHEVRQADINKESKEAFLEELVVRRELTDNFCYYNQNYDTVSGAHEWAQKTIAAHADDEREYVYTTEALEAADTHDELWNAMQTQMVTEGKMHGWCRMYWAKKILEWTPNVQIAIETALYLNDKYELDGRDPNGVVGVMWAICGVHDRAWTERPIFGKIRYMNYNGARRKFDVDVYIARYRTAEPALFDDEARA